MEHPVPGKHNCGTANHAPTSSGGNALAYEMLYLISDDREKIIRRFMSYVSHTPFGCWEWRGARNAKGYGAFKFNRTTLPAHRAAHILWKSRVPNGLQVDHVCNNRSCVNPEHLQLVTQYQNKILGKIRRARATHCANGHELSEENLVLWMLKASGFRGCLTCRRKSDRERQSLRRQRVKARNSAGTSTSAP